MGVWDDLRYFGPAIGARRGLRLLTRKLRKETAKKKMASELRGEDPEGSLLERLRLDPDPESRVKRLRDVLNPLVALSTPEDGAGAGSLDATAQAVLEGRQLLFGREVQVGWPPRWNWRWNGTPEAATFSRDVRSTWELQRLQGILPLARAARAGDAARREGYGEAYIEALLDFHGYHPGPDGEAWASALEVGLRLVSLTQGLPLVADTAAFAARHMDLLRMMDRHARWLGVDLSLDKVVRGNHFLGELAGLVAVGHLLPDARWNWWGSLPAQDRLEKEILIQFHSDGVSVEQSLTYEKFILEFLVVAGGAAAARDEPLSDPVRERLLAAADHLEASTAPDGSLPRVGDCDSGRGADWGDADPHRPQDLVSRIRAVFGFRGADTEWGPVREEKSHGTGLDIRRFPHGGHLVVRSPEGDFLFVRGGPFGWGIPGPASHSHADWLSPVLYLGGEALWVDPGVFGYDVGASLRDAYRGWDAHNVVYFEPSTGPVPVEMFRWSRIGSPAAIDVRKEKNGIEVQGRVRWRAGARPLLWHRSIRYNELDGIWQIRDRTSGDIPGPLSWAFHFAPGVEIDEEGDAGRFRLTLPRGGTRILELAPRGAVSVDAGWVAPAYGSRVQSFVLRRRLDALPKGSEITLLPG